MTTITRFTKEQLIAKAEEQIKLTRGLNLTLSAKEHIDMCSVLFEIALKELTDSNKLAAAEKRMAETDLRNTALALKIEPMDRQVGELTMWVKRLAHSLRKAKPDSKLHSDAMDYLSRNGLISVEDVLR